MTKMRKTREALRKLILTRAPDPLLQIARKIYYPYLLQTITADHEIDLEVVQHLVKPGDCVADIGSNYGIYTLYLSHLIGAGGHVYSIEPVPSTFEVLCAVVQKSGARNAVLVNCAISDFNGSVTIVVPQDEFGVENFYRARIVRERPGGSLKSASVESRTLDSLFADLPCNVSFIKCDVEGHELNCIKGATNILKYSRPAWLIEVTGEPGRAGSSAHEVFELLSEVGYAAYWFDGKMLNRWHLDGRSVNYFFLQPEHIQSLRNQNLIISETAK